MLHANLSPTPSRRLRRPAPGRKQSGFSLLEALVSVVVLSFGLLGVAGLQASSLKYSRDARNQSVAVNLAREMAEMIRSNARIAGATGDDNVYLTVGSEDQPESLAGTTAPTTTTGPFTGNTTEEISKALAEAQVADWKYRVSQALPGAYATICLDDAPYESTGDNKGLPVWACSGTDSRIIVIKIGWEREDTAGVVKAATAEGVRPFVVLPVTPAGQQDQS